MSKCERCEGVGRVQVEVVKGVLVVMPCPACNKADEPEEQKEFLNQMKTIMIEEPTVVKTFRIVGTYGEPDYLFTGTLLDAIHSAWNYEADVYTTDDNGDLDECLFTPWEDNAELCTMLRPYGLEIVDIDKKRVVRIIEQTK